jgi:hypothetical protein
VKGDRFSAKLCVVGRVIIGVRNHEMDIKRNRRDLGKPLHHLGSKRQSWNEMIVHDIDMDGVRGLDISYCRLEIGEISGQDAGVNPNVHEFRLPSAAYAAVE